MRAHPDVNGVAYIRENFKQLLGKVYTPFEDKATYSLALENPEAVEVGRRVAVERENAEVLESLRGNFYVEPCELGRNPNEVLPACGKVAARWSSGKAGVLLVMMENFEAKSLRFLTGGKIAVGLKFTRDSMEIAEHIGDVGYVLFHNRRRDGQHLFAVHGCSGVVSAEDVSSDVYRNISTCEVYVVVEFDNAELNSPVLDCTLKECTQKTRYDAQFGWVKDLMGKEI